MSKMLWKPSEESVRQSNMYRFMNFVNVRHKQDFDAYAPLYRWSVKHLADFWAAMWDFAGIIHSAPYREVVDDAGKMPGASWFSGATIGSTTRRISGFATTALSDELSARLSALATSSAIDQFSVS